jgi:pSer/pThr/pTyr-binding forkhead associated (FHA) protein
MEKIDQPVLIAQEGPLKGQRWTLDHPLVIGRDPSCDISIVDRQISRYHARITLTTEGVILEDMGSKNGTYHNSTPVTSPVMLQDGDLLGVALIQQFVFLVSDSTMPLAVPSVRNNRLTMDAKSRRVWVNQKQMNPPLSAQQFKLLWSLYENQGEVINRIKLVEIVWGEDQSAGVSEQALDALIRRLRDRIAEIDPAHQYIDTVRGHGVRLDNPPA